MDLYNIIANWTGWPVVVAFLLLAGGYAYFVLQNHVDLIKEKNELLEKQINELREYAPDVLAQRLSERLRILSEELERLSADHKTSHEIIQIKEVKLNEVKVMIAEVYDQLKKARDSIQLVSDFGPVCQQCGAPQITKETRYESVESGVIDYEVIVYECGQEIIDGEITSECQRSKE